MSSAPFTSIVNPLDDKEALLFYVAENGRPSLRKHFLNEDANKPTTTGSNDFPGRSQTIFTGSFTALKSSGLLNVYGLIKESGCSENQCHGSENHCHSSTECTRVAQVSPVYKIITAGNDKMKASGVALTTTVDKNGQGWMYYIAGEGGHSVIKEVKLNWKENTVTPEPLRPQQILATSKLAAVYDPVSNKRIVIFQTESSLCSIDTSGDADPIHGTKEDVADDTGIAAVSVKTRTGFKLVVYYLTPRHKLARVIRDEGKKWGSRVFVEGALRVEKSSFLSASYLKEDKETGKILVFYKSPAQPGNTCVIQDDIEE